MVHGSLSRPRAMRVLAASILLSRSSVRATTHAVLRLLLRRCPRFGGPPRATPHDIAFGGGWHGCARLTQACPVGRPSRRKTGTDQRCREEKFLIRRTVYLY